MIGAWAFALLQQGQQFEHRGPGDCCARQATVVRSQAGGLHRDAQAHEGPVGYNDVTRTLRGMTDRQDLEASAVERMGGVGYLDGFRIGCRWVVEGGIMLLSR